MSKDLHMKMDDGLAAAVQEWADQHHVPFTAAVHVLLTYGLAYVLNTQVAAIHSGEFGGDGAGAGEEKEHTNAWWPKP